MASLTASLHVESVLDQLVEAGYEVSVAMKPGRASIRIRRDDKYMEAKDTTLLKAYTQLLESEPHGVSTEGASWAMEGAT